MGKKYRAWDIRWDLDGEEPDGSLPDEVVVETDGGEDGISDALSDRFGFCHNGFKYEELKAPRRPRKRLNPV